MAYSTFWLIFAEETEGGLFDFNATLPLMALQFLLLMVGATRKKVIDFCLKKHLIKALNLIMSE